jgi:hypothetical protein
VLLMLQQWQQLVLQQGPQSHPPHQHCQQLQRLQRLRGSTHQAQQVGPGRTLHVPLAALMQQMQTYEGRAAMKLFAWLLCCCVQEHALVSADLANATHASRG